MTTATQTAAKANAQTPGPLAVTRHHGAPHFDPVGWLAIGRDVAAVQTEARDTAGPANARLLAAGFNAFDRAGRELGVDAATLAEGLDLAALVTAARDALTYLDAMPDAAPGSLAEVAQSGTRYQLRNVLARIAKPGRQSEAS